MSSSTAATDKVNRCKTTFLNAGLGVCLFVCVCVCVCVCAIPDYGGTCALAFATCSLHEHRRAQLLFFCRCAGSNREIFINQATLDSNWRGLSIFDQSYVSIAGCWAASSIAENIWVSPQSVNALLVVSGGTIFNAGMARWRVMAFTAMREKENNSDAVERIAKDNMWCMQLCLLA